MSILQRLDALAPGTIATVAGAGYREGIPAKEADAGWPLGVVRLSSGDLVVADYFGQRLWRIDGQGVLHGFAGDGVPGKRGDGGPALDARLNHPHDLCLDRRGNIYVSDTENDTIRRIDPRSGVISLVAGNGKRGRGRLYFTDADHHVVRRVDEDGTISTVVGCGQEGCSPDGSPARRASLASPRGLAVGGGGEIYVSDTGNHRVRRVGGDGVLTTIAGSDEGGDAGDGGPATAARLNTPHGLALMGEDILLVSDHFNNRLRAVAVGGGR
ncbi:MAG: hypothetical protein CMJ18_27305 [Phycisphaeraceae bacterium]|nr:hypothetical protein [Phycisphaeraceae bacterium]